MELAEDGEHSRWYAKENQDSPQESDVDGVMDFGKVDKVHEQRDVLPRQFLQASYCSFGLFNYDSYVSFRAIGVIWGI